MPSGETLVRLAQVLDVSLDYLTGRSDVRAPADRRVALEDVLPHLPADAREWLARNSAVPYILLAREVAEAGLSPELIRSLTETIRREIARATKPDPGEGGEPR